MRCRRWRTSRWVLVSYSYFSLSETLRRGGSGDVKGVALVKLVADGIQLTPFVSKTVKPLFGLYHGNPKGPKDPQVYLDRWKAENGVE